MRPLFAGVLFYMYACACITMQAVDGPASVRIWGLDFIGQGCPIAPTLLLTARHVAVREFEDGHREGQTGIWEDASGRTGSVWLRDFDLRRDLAVMKSDRPFAQVVPLSDHPPAVGEKVTIYVYDTKLPYGLKAVTVSVLNVVAGRLILSPKVRHGSSGGCVINAQGEVVGIVHALASNDDESFGIAIGVWHPWEDTSWLVPKERP